ncbi:MAG: hypothetical protein PHH37_09935 [Paludibacter sp.]|nr:hypothetical protein [Paludibacter sp.]
MYFNGGNLNLRTPFSATTEYGTYNFVEKDKFSYTEGGINLGYHIFSNKQIHITPGINLGGASLESNLYSDEDDNDKEIYIFNSFIWGPVLHSEFKIYEYKTQSMYSTDALGFFSIKFDFGYNFIAKNQYPEFKGNIPYTRLALIWGIGKF